MRRLNSSREFSPEPSDAEPFDRLDLEGDPVSLPADAIGALRPFGRDLPEQALGLTPETELAPDEWVTQRAKQLSQRGRRLDAVQLLKHFLVEAPTSLAPRLVLAELLEGDEPLQAAALLTQAISMAPNPADLLTRRGALYARGGQPGEAEKDFREAVRKDPSYVPAYRYLGINRLRLGRAGEAVEILREALLKAPDDADATLHLGEALAASGSLEDALGILQRATALCPGDPRPYKLMGRVLDRLGRSEEAMAMHRKAREVTTA